MVNTAKKRVRRTAGSLSGLDVRTAAFRPVLAEQQRHQHITSEYSSSLIRGEKQPCGPRQLTSESERERGRDKSQELYLTDQSPSENLYSWMLFKN